MFKHLYQKYSFAGVLIGIFLFVCLLIFGAAYLLFSVFDSFTGLLLFSSIFGLCFGLSMYQAMAQSRPFRDEVVSRTNTLQAVGIGVVSGVVFLAGGVVLGLLYAQAGPLLGEFSFNAFLVRVLVGVVMGAIVGATFYVPLMGDLAVLFLDYHGGPLYFTGGFFGGVGAVVGTINSTQAVEWWIRILVTLVAGLGGVVIGSFLLGALFVALFTLPFTRRNIP
jgi:hypothetical protein